jgi:hypothetical protein
MSTHPIPSAPLASILGDETRRGFPDNQPWTRVGTDQGGGPIAIIEHLIPPGASPWREQGCTLRPCHYAFRPRASPTASAPRGHARQAAAHLRASGFDRFNYPASEPAPHQAFRRPSASTTPRWLGWPPKQVTRS